MTTATIRWTRDGVSLIDQTLLPGAYRRILCRDVETLWEAIRSLRVRGAPALGVAAAYGVLLGLKTVRGRDRGLFRRRLDEVCAYLASARPTAVNLFHSLDAMRRVVAEAPRASTAEWRRRLRARADAIFEADREVCRRIGRAGASLIRDGDTCLTVCNAGALATVDYGTALGVFYAAKEAGRRFRVLACETRPLLQGARLTAWELRRAGIDVTLICDGAAAAMMRREGVNLVVTGADRIAANGDTANKIGTYALAVAARYHRIPFYVAAPLSTFDPDVPCGQAVPIEERPASEVTTFAGRPIAPVGVRAANPAFDVTDHRLIHGFITERGILRPPYRARFRRLRRPSAGGPGED